MVFLGIDLGWVNGATGLAALELSGGSLRLRSLTLARDHAAAIEWVREQSGTGSAIAAIDAPTIIRNATGQRPCERQLNNVYRRFGLGCHPANLGRPFAANTTGFAQSMLDLGFAHAAEMPAKAEGRWQLEVFPHASIVRFFGLDYRLLYKKGSVAERVAGTKKLRRMLSKLESLDPPCPLPELPKVPNGGLARKDAEDQLDAIVCAYTAAYYWTWGQERCQVFGDNETGFIVTPDSQTIAIALEKEVLP